MKKKPLLVIRRSGYYVNTIDNSSEMKKSWLHDNLTRTVMVENPDKTADIKGRNLRTSMEACRISFTPATEAEASSAPVFVQGMADRFGPWYQIKKRKKRSLTPQKDKISLPG